MTKLKTKDSTWGSMSLRPWSVPVPLAGKRTSRIRRVMTMANTPSLNASSRFLFMGESR